MKERVITLRRSGELWEVLVDGETSFVARECHDQSRAQCAVAVVAAVAGRAASWVDDLEERAMSQRVIHRSERARR